MPNSTPSVYISPRLRRALEPISRCALTTVVAPMGYGKTTAVGWFLSQRGSGQQPRVLRVSVYSDNLPIFWRSLQDTFRRGGLTILQDYDCPADAAGASMLLDDLCHALSGPPCYLFLDDFHLLRDGRVTDFLCELALRLPENVHLILASRDQFLSGAQLLRLGSRLHRIGPEELRLDAPGLSAYARRWGTELTEGQLSELLRSSEGWFSAVYLNLQALRQTGALPQGRADIYEMFSSALLEPLPRDQQEFLAVLGLCDEFTAEMAEFVTGDPRARQRLAALTEQNAFVQRLPDGRTYRFHHMMKACAARRFSELPWGVQARSQGRYGRWYLEHGQYLHAFRFFHAAGDYEGLLRTVARDAGICLSTLDPQAVLTCLDRCPEEILQRHLLALLVLMRVMFNWKNIPKMLALERTFLKALEAGSDLPPRERGNLLGEHDLIMSFLSYNDIGAMSRLHRSASAQMTRPAVSIQTSGGWTFGSPSVLMMFHREPGALERERREMDECMPHYYKVTNGHGQGAELGMGAEADFLQGRFADAVIGLERAYDRVAGNGQESIALCCDLLALRLRLWTDDGPKISIPERRRALLARHNPAWVNIFDSISAYYYAILGQPEHIPALFREHRLSTVHFLAPGRPMMELIENQVYLCQGEYAKVAARREALLETCRSFHYALVAIQVEIQTAAAYWQLGKQEEAQRLLETALTAAAADGLLVGFGESFQYIKDIPVSEPKAAVKTVQSLGERFEERRLRLSLGAPARLSKLTRRELELTRLMAQRLTNREIAQRLYLSEGTVKQYMNVIYAKLQITGDTRTKRQTLLGMLEDTYF